MIVELCGCESKCLTGKMLLARGAASGDYSGIWARDFGVQCGKECRFAGWKGSSGLGRVKCLGVLRLVAMLLAQDDGRCGGSFRGFA